MANIERLKDLSYLLRNLQTELPNLDVFEMNVFYEEAYEFTIPSKTLHTLKDVKNKGTFCGTAACALGSAALWKKFQDQGLYLDEYGEVYFNESLDERKNSCEVDHYEYIAGGEFFGLDAKVSYELFFPEKYCAYDRSITPEEVADRVDAIIDQFEDKNEQQ